jgi:hypothetical protein
MGLMQSPFALPFGMTSMSSEMASPFTGNEPRLPPMRMQAPMPSFSQATPGAPGINPAAMQFLSQMMNQPGAGLMAGNFGTPWEFGTPVGFPSLMGREAVLGPNALPVPSTPPPVGENVEVDLWQNVERTRGAGSER